MKATLFYRIAAVLLGIFGALHTFGFLSFKAPTPAGVAAWDAMNSATFDLDGATLSYGHFYLGFGLNLTVFLFFSAYLAWYLGGLAAKWPGAVGGLGWMFCAVQVAGMVLNYIYFAAPQVIFAGILAICLGCAAWLSNSQAKTGAP